MRVEAVVADLDGTLVGEDYSVSPATVESLRTLRAANVPLVIATGRVPQGLRELGPVARYARIMVCCSGSIGRTVRRELWQYRLLSHAAAQVVDTAVSYGAGVAGFDGTSWQQTEQYERLGPKHGYGAPCTTVPTGVLRETRCVTMSVLHDRAGALVAVARDLAGLVGVGLSRVAGMDILDITSPDVDKGVGVLRALKVLGANPAAAVSFGDMPNDLPMFAVTGRAYAVGCGHPDVVTAVHEVLAPVEDDGFASKINALAASEWRMV